jgi:hypothetical protein
LVNISNRGFIGSGSDVQIPGFVIRGTRGRVVLARAVGPTLGSPVVDQVNCSRRSPVWSGPTNSAMSWAVIAVRNVAPSVNRRLPAGAAVM